MTKSRHPSRYVIAQSLESQNEPGSRGRVLRNRLGIRSKREMDKAEHDALVAAQAEYLKSIDSRTRFTSKLLCQMHRDWLGDIYEWAGHYRSVELQKGDFAWPPAYRVAPNMDELEKRLLATHTPCAGSLEQVALMMAQVHAELLLIHPFREGNGRLARWLADLMSLQAGLPAPLYSFGGRGGKDRRIEYLDAVRQGYARRYEPLARYFLEALERRLRNRKG